ncbi:MAG: PepSY domain-containing protein [Carbonactinosporaceae bacterium]
MRNKLKGTLITGALVAVVAGGGAATAVAAGGDDDKTTESISGAALGKAKTAALDHTGGGRVTGSELGDEEGYYEVEVTKPDGTQVDVHLDRGFNVLGGQADHDGSGED